MTRGGDCLHFGGGGHDTFVGSTRTPGTIDASNPDSIEDFFRTSQGVEFPGLETFQIVVTT